MRVSFMTITQLRAQPRLHPSPAPPALTAAVLIALLALGGCGITTTAGAGVGASGSAPHATATSPAAAAARANPCPGPAGSVNDAGTPALVLTPQTPNRSGTARVGSLVQVRLPDTSHWDYLSAGSFAPLSPAGLHDAAVGVCVWNFRPQSPGSVKLSFARSAICHPGTPCPQYFQQVGFALSVTS